MRGAGVATLLLMLASADGVLVQAEPKAEDGALTLAVPTPGTVSSSLIKELPNGLTHRLRYTLNLRAEGDGQVLLTDVLTTEVVYDLWDEKYVVKHIEGGSVRPPSRVKDVDKVKGILERPRFRAFVPLRSLDASKRYIVDVTVEVNPVSQEVLSRTRELLSPPPGDSDSNSARSFLGNVARLFVNESSTSRSTPVLKFTSKAFVPPTTGGAP